MNQKGMEFSDHALQYVLMPKVDKLYKGQVHRCMHGPFKSLSSFHSCMLKFGKLVGAAVLHCCCSYSW
jgi:hypothetical protein